MRLLRVDKDINLVFEEFINERIPPYAILSHTWGNGEVGFEDMENGSGKRKEGFSKIYKCAKKARAHEINYIWVDTCCMPVSGLTTPRLTDA